MTDDRIVYGVGCFWWGSIKDVAVNKAGLPVCPNCQSPLFEVENQTKWDQQITAYVTKTGDTKYVEFIAWLKGKCRTNIKDARAEFESMKLISDNLVGVQPFGQKLI